MLVRADEEFAVADGQGAVERFVKGTGRQQFEFGTGGQNERLPFQVADVQFAVG